MSIQTSKPQPLSPTTPWPAILWLKTPTAPEKGDDTEAEIAVEEKETEERLILCRECLFPITREEEQTSMSGASQHTFANPAGIVFTIGCFGKADGCATVGPSSEEFTWFPGFAWRVGVCRGCMAHLGWYFAAPSGAAFWALILDHLVFPQ